jgi:FkbM family methyltransferase
MQIRAEEIKKKLLAKYSSKIQYFLPYTYKRILAKDTTKKLDVLFFNIVKELEIKSLIECGANEASASIIATEMGLKALAIEANPLTFKEVTPETNRNFAKVNIGLSDKSGWLDFNIPKSNNTAGSATFRPKRGIDYFIQQVQIKKLDDLLENSNYVSAPFAIWIDVEGMQAEVLMGASKTLQNKNCILLKIEVEDLILFSEQRFLANDVINYLNSFGFELIFRDFEFTNQYNLLFVKRELKSEIEYKILNNFIFNIKPISFIYAIQNLEFKRETKAFLIKILGDKLGNKISAIFGSKSSKDKLKHNQQ